MAQMCEQKRALLKAALAHEVNFREFVFF